MTISRYDDFLNRDFLSQEVQITAVYFRGGDQANNTQSGQRFESFPKRMVYDGREYTFLESSMRYLIQKGQQLIKLFDVSDGHNSYRLRCEDDHWTLVNMQAAA